MAENGDRNTETFVLGLIVAAIIYFIFRREMDRKLGTNAGGGTRGTAGTSTRDATKGCCGGCSQTQAELEQPTNPGVSIGGQSYNNHVESFGSSSVRAASFGTLFGTG